jgi:hypothetical protein
MVRSWKNWFQIAGIKKPLETHSQLGFSLFRPGIYRTVVISLGNAFRISFNASKNSAEGLIA